MLVHEYDCCARALPWLLYGAASLPRLLYPPPRPLLVRFSDSPSWEEVTLGSDVGGRGSSTCPEPKLCRSRGADPPADIEGNESGAPEDGMLTVTLKLPCYYKYSLLQALCSCVCV